MVHQAGLLELDRSYVIQGGHCRLQNFVVWLLRLLIADRLRTFILQKHPPGGCTGGKRYLELSRSEDFLPFLSPGKHLSIVHG